MGVDLHGCLARLHLQLERRGVDVSAVVVYLEQMTGHRAQELARGVHRVRLREVEGAFRTTRRHVVGHDVRERSERVLEVGRFVAQQTEVDLTHPSWPQLHRRWNRAYPEWAYEIYRGFRQAYMRLKSPGYRRPKWKGRETLVDTGLTLTQAIKGEQAR